MCGSNRQRVSSRLKEMAGWMILAAVAVAVFPAGVETACAGPRPVPVLRLSGGDEGCPGCSQWLKEDAAWLRQLKDQERAFVDLPEPARGLPDTLTLDLRALAALGGQVRTSLGGPGKSGRPLVSRIRDRWFARGYLQAAVRWTAGGQADPDTLFVDPGQVWTLAGITLEGPDFPGRQAVLKNWLPRIGTRFAPAKLGEAMAGLLEALGERGYPFPRWVTRKVELDTQTHGVTLAASLLPGSLSRIGPVTSDLPEGPGSDFLVRASGLRGGQLFSSASLKLAVQRLQARDLYDQVGEPRVYLTPAADTVGIYFPVVPRRKVNRLQVVLGLSRNNSTGPSRLSGQVDLDLLNMAGTGRNLQAGWRDDGVGTSRIGFQFREPLLLGSPLDMTLGMNSEVRKDVYTRFDVTGTWELPVVALWGLGGGLGWNRATYPVGDLEHTSRLLVTGSVIHRRGDMGSSGWFGNFGITSARGSTRLRGAGIDSLAQDRLGNSTSVRIYSAELSGELWLGKTLSLAARTNFCEQTGGDPVVPLAEQFWFGGANSLRGYNEREFHGSRAAWGSLELRIGKVRSSRLYTFWDLGYFHFVRNSQDNSQFTETIQGRPHGFGLGLLARTRGGDLSLAIGFPGTVDFDLAKLHVTLLESF